VRRQFYILARRAVVEDHSADLLAAAFNDQTDARIADMVS
jgi:hypothetical protein